MMNILAKSARECREAKGWSRQQLANAADIHRHTVDNIEAGLHAPSIYTVMLLADALGVSLDEYVGRKKGGD